MGRLRRPGNNECLCETRVGRGLGQGSMCGKEHAGSPTGAEIDRQLLSMGVTRGHRLGQASWQVGGPILSSSTCTRELPWAGCPVCFQGSWTRRGLRLKLYPSAAGQRVHSLLLRDLMNQAAQG